MNSEYHFYDTSSLLLKANNLFNNAENIIISSITLTELEEIKTSSVKDAEIKYAARHLLHMLNDNPNKYTVWIYDDTMLKPIVKKNLPINNDMKILASAIDYDKREHPDETIFITNDLSLKNIANLFFGNDSVVSLEEEKDEYLGYRDIMMIDDDMAELYSNMSNNILGLLINEYVIIRNTDNQPVDGLVWTGTEYRHFSFESLDSKQFGKITPMDYP